VPADKSLISLSLAPLAMRFFDLLSQASYAIICVAKCYECLKP